MNCPCAPPQFRIRISNQGIYLMVTLFEMKTAMDANLLLPLLMLVLSLHGTSFTKCPPSEYSAPNGTHYYHTITTLLHAFSLHHPFYNKLPLKVGVHNCNTYN